MSRSPKTPAELARRFALRRDTERSEEGPTNPLGSTSLGSWRRETFRLPRHQARDAAQAWFERYPRAAYLTEVESWRVLDDGRIEFTMRRLPTAD